MERSYEHAIDSINCGSISFIQALTPLIYIRKEPDSNPGGNSVLRVLSFHSAISRLFNYTHQHIVYIKA